MVVVPACLNVSEEIDEDSKIGSSLVESSPVAVKPVSLSGSSVVSA